MTRLAVAARPAVAQRKRTPRCSGGFTLIELMVAMAVALLVLGGIAMVFAGTSRNRADLERSSRLAENAHFALELLSDEVRVAGYFAEMSFVGVAWQFPDPCATTLANLGWSSAPFTAPVSLAGYKATDATPACVPNRKAGTPILVVRRVAALRSTRRRRQAPPSTRTCRSPSARRTPNRGSSRTSPPTSHCGTSTARRSPTSAG